MTADVKVFAKTLEIRATEQIEAISACPAFENARVRIMPDAHAGAGCVIGFTANLGDKVIPNLVGVDIGCGMYACKLSQPVGDLAKFDRTVKEIIPLGFSVNNDITCETTSLDLECETGLENLPRLDRSLGSLGGGNHFIELDIDGRGDEWLVIHCGSRGLGNQVAQLYQQRADAECDQAVPRDLRFLEGNSAQSYLHDMRICQNWAKSNRELIARRIVQAAGLQVDDAFHTVHNYIGDDGVVRKGAISAHSGERVLIPFNMRDGSIIATGLGNSDWNNSAPHGAGRLMSRTAARKNLDIETFKREMRDIYTTTACEGTLDEAPGAYKSTSEILSLISPTVTFDPSHGRLIPRYNLKAIDNRKKWNK